MIHDNFKRPRFEQVQGYAEERQKQSENRLPEERPVIAENAPVDRHVNFGLRILNFGLNYGELIADRHREIPPDLRIKLRLGRRHRSE
jgi:hypothetical protein